MSTVLHLILLCIAKFDNVFSVGFFLSRPLKWGIIKGGAGYF